MFCCTSVMFAQNLKSIQLHPVGNIVGKAILDLHGDDRLVLSFDDLDDEMRNYRYAFIHCNADGTPSDLKTFQYLEGFVDFPIENPEFSFNTLQPYVHYEFEFPTVNNRFLKSGNYLLRVFEEYEPEKILIELPFVVLDQKVGITGTVRKPIRYEYQNSGQQLFFKMIVDPSFEIIEAYRTLKVVAQQNGRIDNVHWLRPKYVNGNVFDFDDDDKNVYEGGSEFRYFDMKSLDYKTQFIQKIGRENDTVKIQLKPGKSRHIDYYMFDEDLNGEYYIKADRKEVSRIESEYVMVHFVLESPYKKGDVYINGALTNWKNTPEAKMEYDFDLGAYIKSLYLKQGYYNYQYLYCPSEVPEPCSVREFEGSHNETINDYYIFVYYRAPAEYYDQCIGYAKIIRN